MRERLPEPNNEEQGLCHHSQPIQPWLRRCCQRGGTGRILSLGLHTQQNAVVLLNVFVIPYSGLIKHQQLFFFSVCLLCLTFKKILSHILICLTLLSSHMLPAGSSCLPFLQIHLEVLYLVFSLGIVFLHQKGVESPAEPGFQNSCFGIIGENLLVLILSC